MRTIYITILLTCLIIILSKGCTKKTDEVFITQSYEVLGGAEGYNITLLDAFDNSQSFVNEPSNWKLWWTKSNKEKKKFYITARKLSAVGKTTVRVIINNKVISETTSDSIATLTGTY